MSEEYASIGARMHLANLIESHEDLLIYAQNDSSFRRVLMEHIEKLRNDLLILDERLLQEFGDKLVAGGNWVNEKVKQQSSDGSESL